MPRSLSLLLLAVLLLPATAQSYDLSRVYRGGDFEEGMLAPGQVVALFRDGATPSVVSGKGGPVSDQPRLNSLIESFELKSVRPLFGARPAAAKRVAEDEVLRRWYFLTFDGDRNDLADVLPAVASLPDVEQALPVPLHRMHAVVPNDPGFTQQNWLYNTSVYGRDVRAMAGWYHETGSSEVVVAIADSGVDWQHPDLGGSGPDYVDGNIWINQEEYTGTPGVDDDGNGFVDDIRGWDFVDNITDGEQDPPQDTDTPDNDPMDYDGHGTAVAGCVAAIGMNSTGVIGTAFTSKVMALKIGWLPDGSAQGLVGMAFAAQALDYARLNGADVFNASWGSSSFFPLVDAVNAAISAGVIVVTSAGNDNDSNPSYLGNRSDVITVAAVNSNDNKASFSDYGSWVDICAPGVSIYTTSYNRLGSGSSVHSYTSISGTSFSSPITAGAVALARSANPIMSAAEIRALVISSADNIDDVNPAYVGELGSGRLNVLKLFGDDRIEVPEQMPKLVGAVNTLALETGAEIAVLGGAVIQESWQLTVDNDLQILGGYDATYTSRDPVGNPSILQADGARPPLRVRQGVGVGTVIDGFRLTGGEAESVPLAPETGYFGGGARIESSSVTLSNLVVEGNVAGDPSDIGGGGGIAIINASPTLTDVEITGNTGGRGAGLYIYNSAPILTRVHIHDNVNHPGPSLTPSDGGGIYVVGSAAAKKAGPVTFVDLQVSGHSAPGRGGGLFATGSDVVITGGLLQDNEAVGDGGGFYMNLGSLTATDLDVLSCAATGSSKGGGGGFAVGSALSWSGGSLMDNTCTLLGGGLNIQSGAPVLLEDLLVTGNDAVFVGSGVYATTVSDFTMQRCTVASNLDSSVGGHGIYLADVAGIFANNLIAFNGTTAGGQPGGVACSATSLSATCNLLWENAGTEASACVTPGVDGNVEADPLFCDLAGGDYSIPPTSPAAAAQSGCGTIGSDPETCQPTAVDEGEPRMPRRYALGQNVPNPFNPQTTIAFALPQGGPTTLRVFDVRGRRVLTLVDGDLPAGEHQVVWNGRGDDGARVASGVYFYEIRSGSFRAVKKMGLVK
jgi:subtilisin family serine protease